MFIPIRRRIGRFDIFVTIIIGTVASLYAWNPIIKEEAQKAKLRELAAKSQQQSIEPEQKTSKK